MLIKTLHDYDYSQVDDRLFNHNGCIVDVGCSGWDWSSFFIGKKRVIGIDPYEAEIPGVTFFEGLLGPVNGDVRIRRNGPDTTFVGEMDLSNDVDFKTFPMLNWKTFKKTYNIDTVSVLKMNIEGAEYSILMSLDEEDFKQIDQITVSFHSTIPGVVDKKTQAVIDYVCEHGYSYITLESRYGWGLFIKNNPDPADFTNTGKVNNATLVTGLWNLGRGNLESWAQRDFETYKQSFFELLKVDMPMVVYAPSLLHDEIWQIRSKHNTVVFTKEVADFKTWFPFFEEHESIRTNPTWYNKAGWLRDSPQAALPFYNPMMMTKMFMVNDAAIFNPFDTEYFYWIDGGLTSTVPSSLLADTNIYNNITEIYSDKIVHIAYPYEANTEIHGYDKRNFYKECGVDFKEKTLYISRGGFWGGHYELIHKYNELYYSILERTIKSGNAGADECLFTIAAYNYPELIERFLIPGNGLVYPFFETLQNLEESKKVITHNKILTAKNASTTLYVLGFNSPKQFERLCESIKEADQYMFDKVRKILVNNTIDSELFEEYDVLCERYGFEEIHKDNIGICGGRQFIAEHFDESGADFYLFFEDDMLFNPPDDYMKSCRNGFIPYVRNIYDTIVSIMIKHKFDFLKLTFSEFYGDNGTQWAWYNVPQDVRTEHWPDHDKLPEHGTDPNAPRTKFNNIFSYHGVSYITGEIYYSNWPQIVSREGNRKMFLDEKWTFYYEQTWMSHIYQRTVKGEIVPAILLASPISHDRFEFYEGSLRKES